MIVEKEEEQKPRKVPLKAVETGADGQGIQHPRFQPKTLKQVVPKVVTKLLQFSRGKKKKREVGREGRDGRGGGREEGEGRSSH